MAGASEAAPDQWELFSRDGVMLRVAFFVSRFIAIASIVVSEEGWQVLGRGHIGHLLSLDSNKPQRFR